MTVTTDSTAAAIAANPEIAVELVRLAIGRVDPGPETVTAALPATMAIDWGDQATRTGKAYGNQSVSEDRGDKMHLIRTHVRARLDRAGVLVKMPQILLAASDGVVIELLGIGRLGIGRLGIAAGQAAAASEGR
jgi:hypothetical protein